LCCFVVIISNNQITRYNHVHLSTFRLKLQTYISDQLRGMGIPKDWVVAGRPCSPRALFVFEMSTLSSSEINDQMVMSKTRSQVSVCVCVCVCVCLCMYMTTKPYHIKCLIFITCCFATWFILSNISIFEVICEEVFSLATSLILFNLIKQYGLWHKINHNYVIILTRILLVM